MRCNHPAKQSKHATNQPQGFEDLNAGSRQNMMEVLSDGSDDAKQSLRTAKHRVNTRHHTPEAKLTRLDTPARSVASVELG